MIGLNPNRAWISEKYTDKLLLLLLLFFFFFFFFFPSALQLFFPNFAFSILYPLIRIATVAMLSALRQRGVFHVACKCRANSQLLKWQGPLHRGAAPVVAVRSLHILPTPARFNSQVAEEGGSDETQRSPSTFAELDTRGLINPRIIDNIVGEMGITTMTPVQQMTLPEIMGGSDM